MLHTQKTKDSCKNPNHTCRNILFPLILYSFTLLTNGSSLATELPIIEPTTWTERYFFSEDKRDDPAIWIHPTDPSKSLVLGADKRDSGGGLHVYNIDAEEVQYLEGGKLNNVDIITGFFPDGDLILASERNNKTVLFYKINPQGIITPLTSSIGINGEPYGICGGTESKSGTSYIFVTTKTGPIEQWAIQAHGPNKIDGQKVRTLPRRTQCEGCVVDRRGEYVFIGEEDSGVFQYFVNPRTDNIHSVVDEAGEHLAPDVEGMTLYDDGKHEYLIVSSQGNSTFAVYDLNQNQKKRYIGSFKVDGATETDGIAVTAQSLGDKYPHGLFVVHSHRFSNFFFVPWEKVEKALGITTSP